MAAKLDPVPSWRKKWERRKVMNSVRRRGRLTQSEVIKRTEREGVYKSEMWKTSMKKLAPLARQIAGKTVDEAIVQMGFSKKKNATWIKDFLKKAQVTAHVERGMGIPDDLPGKKQRLAAERKAAGLPPLTPDALNKASLDRDTRVESESATPEPKTTIVDEKEEREPEDPLEKIRAAIRKARKEALDQRIFLKDGSPHSIASPTNMYIAQAWVNKGSYGTDIIKRARGRRDRLMLPQTSISTIVKEEVTRIREHQQRQDKEAKRKPWIQLPNRPITASHSRPFYTW